MKKLILILFCMVFLIGTVSAIDIDDVKYYDEGTKTYTLENFFGLGKHIADLELKTPQVFEVARGYRRVAMVEIRNGEYDYNEIINGIKLYNINEGMKETVRTVDYKYKKIIQVPNYKTICDKGFSANGTFTDLNCRKEQIGLRDKTVWKDFTKNSLLKGETITLGLFTDVQKGDHIEWVINVYGNEKLTAWAEWNENMLVGVIAHYDMNETSGTNTDNVFDHTNNGTSTNMGFIPWFIQGGYDFDGTADILFSQWIEDETFEWTYNFWMNPTDSALGDQRFFTPRADTLMIARYGAADAGCVAVRYCILFNGTWHETGLRANEGDDVMVTFNHNGTGLRFGLNGTYLRYFEGTPVADTSNNRFGAGSGGANQVDMQGDELTILNRTIGDTELLDDWYNGGAGRSFRGVFRPIVNITFPLNITYNTTQTQLNYTVDASGVRCWFSTDGGVTNSSDNDCTENFITTSVVGGNTWTVYSNNSEGTIGQDSVTFTVESGIEINLISPIDNLFTSNTTIDFKCNATDNLGLVNLTLILNGIDNETNTTIGDSMVLSPTLTLAQDVYTWACRAEDNESFILTSENRTFEIGITAPTLDILFPNVTIPLHQLGTNLTLNWSITEPGRNLTEHITNCSYTYNAVTVNLNTTSCVSINKTSFLYVSGVNNLSMEVTDLFNNTAIDNVTFDILVLEDTIFFNSTSFETKRERFILNITSNGTAPLNGRFIYDGDIQTATITNVGGNNYNLSGTIELPINAGNKTFFFSTTINGVEVNTSSRQQTVNAIHLAFCNSTITTPYINFTFHNETTGEEDITAFIGSTWVYYIGSGGVNKTLNYANVTENHHWTFCFEPGNHTISSTLSLSYNNAQSQQRVFIPTLLTLSNITTTQKLFLLPTALGLFTQFKTEDTIGNTLTLVKAVITRVLGGNTITITSSFTDGSGLVVFFLNPDILYTGTFTKSGFTDNIFTFVPITDLRTVVMGSTTVVPVEGSNISIGTTYKIQPNNDSLNNNTLVTFSFNVTSGQPITLISMNITNSTHQISFQSNAGAGFISDIINTRNNEKMFGEFIIQTADETINIKRVWNIGIVFIGDYSLFRQLTLFNEYNFNEFFKFLIVLVVVMGLLMFLSGDQQVEDEIKMAAVTALVWAFSIVGWLDTGIVLTTASGQINLLAQFSNQYGLAILTTIGASYFILRRMFRQI